jgi:hypothetical protein
MIEAFSEMLQVASFRLTGKRLRKLPFDLKTA